MNVMNVWKPYSESHLLLFIWEVIQGWKPMNVMSVGKPSLKTHYLTIPMRSLRGEKPFECNECGKAFCKRKHLLLNMWKVIQVRHNKCSETNRKINIWCRVKRKQRLRSCFEYWLCHSLPVWLFVNSLTSF